MFNEPLDDIIKILASSPREIILCNSLAFFTKSLYREMWGQGEFMPEGARELREKREFWNLLERILRVLRSLAKSGQDS